MSITYRFTRDRTYEFAAEPGEVATDAVNAVSLFCAQMGGGWSYRRIAEDDTSATFILTPPSQFDPDRAAAVLAQLCSEFRLDVRTTKPIASDDPNR